jgi:hypothetical protein
MLMEISIGKRSLLGIKGDWESAKKQNQNSSKKLLISRLI